MGIFETIKTNEPWHLPCPSHLLFISGFLHVCGNASAEGEPCYGHDMGVKISSLYIEKPSREFCYALVCTLCCSEIYISNANWVSSLPSTNRRLVEDKYSEYRYSSLRLRVSMHVKIGKRKKKKGKCYSLRKCQLLWTVVP